MYLMMFVFFSAGNLSSDCSNMVFRIWRYYHFCDYWKAKWHIQEKL